MADNADPVHKPHDWDKAVAAAYLRQIGHTQVEAAKGAGVGGRTLERWEKCSWWGDALEEAADRWLVDAQMESRASILRAVKGGDADLGLKILERTDPRLMPAKQRLEVQGMVGVQHLIAQLPPERVERLLELSDDELREEIKRLGNGTG